MSLIVWEVTIAVLLAVLLFDLALAIIRRNKETSMKEAAAWTIFYVSSAIIFGYSLGDGIPLKPAESFLLAGLLSIHYL